MGNSLRTRALLLFVLILTFGGLLFGGYLITKEKPPIPSLVTGPDGETLFSGGDIKEGQQLFLSHGGQHLGTIWGHGSYLAPDWSADWLHREGLYLAARLGGATPEQAAAFDQKAFDAMAKPDQAARSALVAQEIKTNRYDATTGRLSLSGPEAESFALLTAHYGRLFREGDDKIGIQPGIVSNDKEAHDLASFFAWLAWSAGTNRPGQALTYTSNWPYDPLVGNLATPDSLIWSIVSVVLLILGLALAIFWYARYLHEDATGLKLALTLDEPSPTGSQRASVPYFIAAMALFVLMIPVGVLTAHYYVEGGSFFGVWIEKIFPYAALRTWHLQLAIFWIATCFLATGLFIGPFVGKEPKWQKPLVLVLLAAVVLVVVGAMSGTWLSIQGFMGSRGFLFGTQGYEYVELGRFWQLLLIVGMIIWLVLVVRAILPALKNEKDAGGLTHVLLYSAITIPAFYMWGLMYNQKTDLSDAEYWRWWVVHLWVEGFFEVFATVVLSFVLVKISAISARFAERVIYFSIILYLGAGIVGTFHHLYWTGTPSPIIALGAVFSALEIVPLALLGFETAQNTRMLKEAGKAWPYRWPVMFFIATAFWNMVGAGVFGFLINPPIVLYYIQGLNTTPLHAHTALFGVYGFFAIALMLFSLRHIVSKASWSDSLLKWAFWLLNGGLAAMTVLTLIPQAFYQMYWGISKGLWYARSPEIATSAFIKTTDILRMLPDIVFGLGAVLLLWFVVRAAWISFVTKKAGSRNAVAGPGKS
jgi:nitric oxide reductase subunit B